MVDCIAYVLGYNPAAVAFASDCAAYLVGREIVKGQRKPTSESAAAAHEAGHAVVMAALGIQPRKAEIVNRGPGFGGMVTPIAMQDELLTLDNIGRILCVALSGYVGQTLGGSDRFDGAAHEIGIAFYLAKAAEINHAGITAKTAIRASMAECRRILLQYRGQHQSIADKLLECGEIEGTALDSCLQGIDRVPSERWRELAMAGGGTEAFPAIEGVQGIAEALALAPQNYAEQIPKLGFRKSLSEIEQHDMAALLFSGGKESVALAHMLKPYRDRLTLVWVNTGMMFPHMAEFVRGFAERHGYKLAELRSDQGRRFATHGLPSKILSTHNSRMAMACEENPKPRLLLTDHAGCCSELRYKPVIEWMLLTGTKAVIHGQRAEDKRRPRFDRQFAEIAPLWDWSGEDVYEYLRANDLELPEQYGAGYADSGECWNCTSEINAERFRWMGKRYPDLLVRLVPVLADCYGVLRDQMDQIEPGLTAGARAYKEIMEAKENERAQAAH